MSVLYTFTIKPVSTGKLKHPRCVKMEVREGGMGYYQEGVVVGAGGVSEGRAKLSSTPQMRRRRGVAGLGPQLRRRKTAEVPERSWRGHPRGHSDGEALGVLPVRFGSGGEAHSGFH